VGAFYGKRNIT